MASSNAIVFGSLGDKVFMAFYLDENLSDAQRELYYGETDEDEDYTGKIRLAAFDIMAESFWYRMQYKYFG